MLCTEWQETKLHSFSSFKQQPYFTEKILFDVPLNESPVTLFSRYQNTLVTISWNSNSMSCRVKKELPIPKITRHWTRWKSMKRKCRKGEANAYRSHRNDKKMRRIERVTLRVPRKAIPNCRLETFRTHRTGWQVEKKCEGKMWGENASGHEAIGDT